MTKKIDEGDNSSQDSIATEEGEGEQEIHIPSK